MFERFIKWLAADYIAFATREGYHFAKDETAKSNAAIKQFEMDELVGQKVITFSNEWEDMLVGTVIKIEYITKAKQPTLVIEDCFSGIQYLSFGQIYKFDIKLLDALLKLTPYERWNIKASNAPVRWDKPVNDDLTSPAKFRQNLQTIGFI